MHDEDSSGDSSLLTEQSVTYDAIKVELGSADAAACPSAAAAETMGATNPSPHSPVTSPHSAVTESADENDEDDVAEESSAAAMTSPMLEDSSAAIGGVASGQEVASKKNRVVSVAGGSGEKSECRVCGDEASGMYFGALVCVPCKTFFLRYAGEGKKFTCRYWRSCDVTVSTRTQCKSCRYQKCIRVGMRRRVRPVHVQVGEGQQLCAVCSDVGNGIHFGVITCEGCKKFFRRGLVENSSYRCKSGGQCSINPQTRNLCRYCRFWKCVNVGMSRNAIQMGRPTKCLPSATDVGNASGQQQQQRSVPACLKPINCEPSPAASSPVKDAVRSFAEASVLNWIQANDVSGTSAGPSGSTPMPMFSRTSMPSHIPTWLQTGGLLFSLPGGLLFPSSGVRVGQPEDLQLISPTVPMPFPNGLGVGGEARNQSVSPDSTVKEDEVQQRSNRQPTNSGADASCKGRKRTVSYNSGQSGSRLVLEDSALGPAHKYHAIDENAPEVGVENNVGLDLRRGSSLLAASQRLEPSSGSTSSNVTRNSNSETANLSVASCEGRIAKAYRIMSQRKHRLSASEGSISAKVKTEDDELLPLQSDAPSLDQMSLTSLSYWLKPRRDVGELMAVGQQHWDVVNGIIPAYDRFVHQGDCLNRMLKNDFEEWSRCNGGGHLSNWIKTKVIPAYTVASVNYCKSLPGFQNFDADDQVTIIRLGQSSSRILLASIHWFDAEDRVFRNFLSWRSGGSSRENSSPENDLFKKMLVEYANKISSLEPDPIEAALLNVLLIFASDYPYLKCANIIEEARSKIIATLHAYTSAKFGTPINRVGQLCSVAPEARRLGLLHYQMTKTKTMTVEEVGQRARATYN